MGAASLGEISDNLDSVAAFVRGGVIASLSSENGCIFSGSASDSCGVSRCGWILVDL